MQQGMEPGLVRRFRRRVDAARRKAVEVVALAEAARETTGVISPRQNAQRPYRLHEISIELTSKCNLTCEMCSVWKGGRDGLSRKHIFDLLAQARALGALVFTACGAEAFMRKDTPLILAEAARLGYQRISVITNGVLIRRHRKALAKIPGLELGVSIEGPESVHDALRGAGTYRAAIDGVRAVRDGGVSVHLCAVLMRPTLATADYVIDLAVELGLSSVSYQPFQPEMAWDKDDHSPWHFDPADKETVSKVLENLRDKARSVGIHIITETMFPVIPPYLFEGTRPIPSGGCALPSRFILVTERGETYPCFFMRGQSMGNVAEGVRLRDIWHGPVQRKMQARGLNGACPGCLAGCSDIESYNAAARQVHT